MDSAASNGPPGETGRDHPVGAFATTHWSLVQRAQHPGADDAAAALEQLCRTYWYPVYCYARRRSASRADAEDLAQGFFADLLERGALNQADAARGHFRSFLLASFRHYCAHERDRANAKKRGGGCEFVSLADIEGRDDFDPDAPVDEETATRTYDRKWALCVVECAAAAVAREYTAIGKDVLFESLRPLVLHDGTGSTYAEIAQRMGMTAAAVKVAAFRLRRRLAHAIREEIARTVSEPGQVDEEMRFLLAAMST